MPTEMPPFVPPPCKACSHAHEMHLQSQAHQDKPLVRLGCLLCECEQYSTTMRRLISEQWTQARAWSRDRPPRSAAWRRKRDAVLVVWLAAASVLLRQAVLVWASVPLAVLAVLLMPLPVWGLRNTLLYRLRMRQLRKMLGEGQGQ